MGDALRHCADLKSVFRRHSGGWLDRESLSRVKDLCTRTADSAQDPHTRFEIARVAFYAEQLYSHRGPRTDLLRERILLSLESVESRLYRG
jgi:hypothetical protein